MRLPFNGTFPLSQEFGKNPEMYAKFGLKGHSGMDWKMPGGTPIFAPHAGTILEALYDPTGYGWYVKIESETEGSVLAHFESEPVVKYGDKVEEGQLVGHSGSTGNSTGDHLHWGYYRIPRDRGDGFNGYIDQRPMLEELHLIEPLSVDVATEEVKEDKTRTEYEYQELVKLKDAAMADRENFWKLSDELKKELEVVKQELGAAKTTPNLPTLNTEEFDRITKEREEYKELATKLAEDLRNKTDADAQSHRLEVEALKAENEDLRKQGAELLLTLDEVKKNSLPSGASLEERNQLTNQITELKGQLLALQKKYDICQTDYQTYRDSVESSPLVQQPMSEVSGTAADEEIKQLKVKIEGLLTELKECSLARGRAYKELERKEDEDCTAITMYIEDLERRAKGKGVKQYFKMVGEDLFTLLTKGTFKN